MSTALSHILIYGSGLALEYAAATLVRALPATIKFTVIEDSTCNHADAAYGSIMPPTAYNFHRSAGIEEPDLILQTNTSLSYGTHYSNWGAGLDWVQCYQLPLPIWNGVRFHHYLTRLGERLEPYLPGAVAGRAGRFAHPPEDSKMALSRAEYGYQFCTKELTSLLASGPVPKNVKRVNDSIDSVRQSEAGIADIRLTSGETFNADLYIDASGPSGALASSVSNQFNTAYAVCLSESETPSSTGGTPLRQVKGTQFGWTETTHLRDKTKLVTVCHPGDRHASHTSHGKNPTTDQDLFVGQRDQAWVGNCVAIGHAAAVLEPLTTASFLLLMRDIERIVGLLPHAADMQVEAREYNRRFQDDLEHANLFHTAMFQTKGLPKASYYQAITGETVSEKLTRKITQFESRGGLVAYDLEPFNEQDWTILHFGMGRRAARHDVYIDNLTDTVINRNLTAMKHAVSEVAKKMPPHGIYLSKMQQYLERKHGRDI